jgi:hypothetical protein
MAGYSYLSAAIGSILVTRRAGIKLGVKATAIKLTQMEAKVSGSVALTPNSRLDMSRVKAKAAANLHKP